MSNTLAESPQGDPYFRQQLALLDEREQHGQAWSHKDALRYCRTWAHVQYENFTVVSWLLPKRLRQDFYNTYAFCRWSDNLADELPDPEDSLRRLVEWQRQLETCWSPERPCHPILIALQDTIQRHELEKQPFFDLLAAFRQDQQRSRYEDHDQLLDYCRHSANPVGRILLRLARCDTDENRLLSDSVCTGLQLANFCQDMSRDAGIDRIYAPRCLWAKHGVQEAEILARQCSSGLQAMLQEWVGITHEYFRLGQPLVERVPRWLAVDVQLFIDGGKQTLAAIERQHFDVWTKRPEVGKATKVRLLGTALIGRWRKGKR